jgi:hypothetical protein
LTTVALAHDVLVILTTENAASKRDGEMTDLAESASSLSETFSNAAIALQVLHFPPADRTAAGAETSTLENLSYDAIQLATATGPSVPGLEHTLAADEMIEAGDAAALRRALGLPQAAPSS